TFWLDPDYDHKITATKTGYSSVQVTHRPTQSIYTIVMGATAGDAEYESDYEGLDWIIKPTSGPLTANNSYLFTFNLTATKSNLVNCKMEITNITQTILASAAGCTDSSQINLSLTFNVSDHPYLYGRYSVDVGDGYFTVDTDAYWIIFEETLNITSGTLKNFFEHLSDFSTIRVFGEEEHKSEFSRIILFFLVLFIAMGSISYSTGWEMQTQGGALLVLFPVVLFASIGGFFTMNLAFVGDVALPVVNAEFWNKYLVAFITA
ncbi:unnamed protein product, partial [marine sediment metagenome]